MRDVVVIGGGLVGCLSALRLAQAGARVTVLERSVPGAEASSAAAGILAGQSESGVDGPMSDLAVESRDRYAALADELRATVGSDIGYRRCGVLDIARDDATLDALDAKFAWQRGRGLRVERLDAAALGAREAAIGGTLAGGVFFPDDAQVDAGRLVSAVAQAAERAGVVFQTGAYVRRVEREGSRAVGVTTDQGFVPAEHVVVAAGAWSTLVEGTSLPLEAVKPARGQIVDLVVRTPPIRCVVFGDGGYLVPRSDGHVLCGSTLEFVGFQREVTASGLAKILSTALSLVPALAGARVAGTWSNFRPFSADGVPLVGDLGIAGLTVATGHHRSGILLAPITAELVVEHVKTGSIAQHSALLAPTRSSLHGKPAGG